MAEGEEKNKRKGYWKDKHLSEETKQKIREALKGRVLSKEGIEKGRQGRLRYYQSHNAPNKGISHSNNTKKKMSRAIKEHWNKRKEVGEKSKLQSRTLLYQVR